MEVEERVMVLIAINIDDDKLRLANKFGATHIINSGRKMPKK